MPSVPKTGRLLRVGEMVSIGLRGIPQSEVFQDIIDEDGQVTLPLVGGLTISGLSPSKAEKVIEKAYVDGGIYRKINVTVMANLGEYYVRGEVRQQGAFKLTSDLTLMQAIAAAGGYTDYADPGKIRVIRGNDIFRYSGPRIERMSDDGYPVATRSEANSSDRVVIPR